MRAKQKLNKFKIVRGWYRLMHIGGKEQLASFKMYEYEDYDTCSVMIMGKWLCLDSNLYILKSGMPPEWYDQVISELASILEQNIEPDY